jgi:predicted DNA binding CopG/RHH family protein
MSKMYREDPYDAMSEEEFEGEILAMLERTKTRAVSLRLPLDLIERTKAVAAEQQVPYQTLMKAFIDGGVRKLEQRHRGRPTAAGRSVGRRSGGRAKRQT